MLKTIAVCVLALSLAAASSAAAPPLPAPRTAVTLSLAVLSADEAQVNVRLIGPTKLALDPSRFAFQLRSKMTGVVYFVGATATDTVNVVARDAKLRAVVYRFGLRIPKVDEGVYDLSVDPGVRSSDVANSRQALSEPLYIRAAGVTPIRAGTKFYLTPDGRYPDLPIETVFNGLLAGSVIPTGAPEIDDPIADALSDQYSHKPLWTFGRLEYTCFGGANMGTRVVPDSRQPMYIDRIVRVGNILTGRPYADPLDCMPSCGENWHSFTYHPLIALFDSFKAEPGWITYATVSASPRPETCAMGTYAFVDDSDIERTFTTEDPRAVHPEWDPALRASMLAFKVDVGMTHEMVAFVMGYPSTTGTRAELEKLSQWNWRSNTSCAAHASFNGDLLVKFAGSIQCSSTMDVY